MFSPVRHIKLLVVLVGLTTAMNGYAEPGEGLRSDTMVASLGLTLSGSYDTNIFYQSTDETTQISSAPSLRFTPFLSLDSLNTTMVQYSVGASLSWQQYLDSEETISAQSGLSANLGATMGINREGAFSVTFKEAFTRTNEPPEGPTLDAYNRNVNSLGVTFGLHPGGKVFQHYLSYDWLVYRHEDIAGINRMMHDFTLTNYWRFLPRTALTLSADYQIIHYDDPIQGVGSISNSNSSPLKLQAGLTGLITDRISARLIAGWGWSFHGEGDSFTGLLVDSRLTWQFGDLTSSNSLYAGYAQSFADTTIGNFYTYYRPYAGYQQRILQRLRLNIDADMNIRHYSGTPDFVGDMSDLLIGVRAGLGFDIYKWWSADVNYRLSMNLTDDQLIEESLGLNSLREYTKHIVSFGTTIRY